MTDRGGKRDDLVQWAVTPTPWPLLAPIGEGTGMPLADVEETDDAYLIDIELPGVAKRDVSLEQAGRRFTVTGQRTVRERVGILRHRTRSTGTFHFEVVLPSEVREDGVDAALADGVLSIRVPKRDLVTSRHVPIV